MTPPRRFADRIAPRRQTNWDWRAAANFIAGGSGGGLLLWAGLIALRGGDLRILLAVGLALVGTGLTCVWFEIGRPWRALNTFRHGATSWMTREALVALSLFGSGIAALWSGQIVLTGLTGLCGLAFVYAQARILRANIGIPAWRNPRCPPLVLATGLTEGAGLMLCASAIDPQLIALSPVLTLLVAVRWWAWRQYLAALASNAAPVAAIGALRRIDGRFSWLGSALPALLAVLASASSAPLLAIAAGALATLAGWQCKYVLVCEAAFTQGFALRRSPVRGSGVAGHGARPGWKG